MKRLLLTATLFAGVGLCQHPLASRTLVVYSSTSSSSTTLANYYKTARGIPNGNMCAITPPDDTSNSITQAQFNSAFKTPIQACINSVGQSNVLYIVMVWIANLRFTHASNGMEYAIDSFVADAFDTIGSTFVTYAQVDGATANPPVTGFYALTNSKDQVWPVRQTLAYWRSVNTSVKLFSVWRIDGNSTALAQGLIDQAIATEAAGGPIGKYCGDTWANGNPEANGTGYTYGLNTMVDWDVYRAGTLFAAVAKSVQYDFTPTEFGESGNASCTGAAAFAGWYGGAGSHAGTYTWSSGAIGIHIDSYSVGNLRAPFNGQTPSGTWAYQELKNGLSVTSGSVAEQYTFGSTRGAGLFRDLLQGALVGDAFLRNTPWAVRWMLVQVGDPLYAPWGNTPLIRASGVALRGGASLRGKASIR